MRTPFDPPLSGREQLARDLLMVSLRGRRLPQMRDAGAVCDEALAIADAMISREGQERPAPCAGPRCPSCGSAALASGADFLVCEHCNAEWRRIDRATIDALGLVGQHTSLGEAAAGLRRRAYEAEEKLARVEALTGDQCFSIVLKDDLVAALAGTQPISPVVEPPAPEPVVEETEIPF